MVNTPLSQVGREHRGLDVVAGEAPRRLGRRWCRRRRSPRRRRSGARSARPRQLDHRADPECKRHTAFGGDVVRIARSHRAPGGSITEPTSGTHDLDLRVLAVATIWSLIASAMARTCSANSPGSQAEAHPAQPSMGFDSCSRSNRGEHLAVGVLPADRCPAASARATLTARLGAVRQELVQRRVSSRMVTGIPSIASISRRSPLRCNGNSASASSRAHSMCKYRPG